MKKIKIFVLILISFLLSNTAHAHVRYLVDQSEFEKVGGPDNAFLLQALQDPKNILIIIISIIAVFIAYLVVTKVSIFEKAVSAIQERADTYHIFTPWMMRLSLGITLIGSGVAESIISPALRGYPDFAFIQILIGFLLISGFLVVPSAIVAIMLYIFSLTQDWYMIGSLEFLSLAIALLILDNEKPGLDHLLGFEKFSPFKHLKKLVPLILRIGIGGTMMFLAVYEKFLNPHASEIIVRDFGLINVIPVSPEMWILGAGTIEFLIGVMLLLGWYTRLSSAIAFVVLSLSFFYFGEDVSSHIILFGTLSVLYITRGGSWSIDCRKQKMSKEFTC